MPIRVSSPSVPQIATGGAWASRSCCSVPPSAQSYQVAMICAASTLAHRSCMNQERYRQTYHVALLHRHECLVLWVSMSTGTHSQDGRCGSSLERIGYRPTCTDGRH